MATRIYRANPEDNDHTITEAAGAATTKYIEVTIDWDSMIGAGISGQQARRVAIDQLMNICNYIETSGKYNVNA